MPPDRDAPERLPPQSQEAERSVLGSILRDNDIIDDITPKLVDADHFYADSHQKIFLAMRALQDKKAPIDLITLAEELRQRGQIEDVGGYGYLGELWDAAPTAAHAAYYAQMVRERAILRRLIHSATEILRDAYDQAQAPAELLNTAERRILEVAERGIGEDAVTLSDAIKAAYDRIDKRQSSFGLSSSGVSTGFRDLDEITAGLQDSEVIIIAARPSVGKTSFALAIARNVILHGHGVFFVSLEQSKIEIAERLLCCQARVDSHRLRKGSLSGEDIERLTDAGGELAKTQLFIDDSPAQTMLRIAANARRLRKRQDIKLVIIDYLQLIEPENRRDPRQEQVAQTSRRLKFLAKELNIPIVALAQVNRSSEDRQDHRPRLADLRESGSIEQDADTVLLLHRPDRYEPGQHEGIIEVIVGKQRNGPTGEVTLAYLKQFMRYEDFQVGTPFEG
jgi:replicative DNA helicase